MSDDDLEPQVLGLLLGYRRVARMCVRLIDGTLEPWDMWIELFNDWGSLQHIAVRLTGVAGPPLSADERGVIEHFARCIDQLFLHSLHRPGAELPDNRLIDAREAAAAVAEALGRLQDPWLDQETQGE